MNYPSQTDDTVQHLDRNLNLVHLNPEIITPYQFNGHGDSKIHPKHATNTGYAAGDNNSSINSQQHSPEEQDLGNEKTEDGAGATAGVPGWEAPSRTKMSPRRFLQTILISSYLHFTGSMGKFARFVGPGFLIAVAYIDPGNYSTDVSAGGDFKYKLLFVVLLSNLFAILLQSLCIKLGTVTGLNLAENCREHLPRWLVIILYIFAEVAIIATDIAEVWIHTPRVSK